MNILTLGVSIVVSTAGRTESTMISTTISITNTRVTTTGIGTDVMTAIITGGNTVSNGLTVMTGTTGPVVGRGGVKKTKTNL